MLSGIGWTTPDFKVKGGYGKLDFEGGRRGLGGEGCCLVLGGVHQIVLGVTHQILKSRVGVGS